MSGGLAQALQLHIIHEMVAQCFYFCNPLGQLVMNMIHSHSGKPQ